MKLKIIDLSNSEKGAKELPEQFSEDIRPDLVKRAVLVIQNNDRQPYGAYIRAGMRQNATISKRRKDYKGCYGHAQSRTPRKVFSRSGMRFNWQGAKAPQTVGGRRSHPPKATKIWDQKINKKERRKAIRSAIASTIMPEIVKMRGHRIPASYPFIIDSKIEDLQKTKDVVSALQKLGFSEELERTSERKIRAGKGKSRTRRYQTKIGPLIVVSKMCNLFNAARNIPGVEVHIVNQINCEMLAPGCSMGRLTLWTADAIDRLDKEKLFFDVVRPSEKKEKLSPVAKEAKKAEQKKEAKPAAVHKAEKPAVKKAETKHSKK